MGINILHYSTGEPFKIVGGLTKYVESLAISQNYDPFFNHVHVLYPSFVSFLSVKAKITTKKEKGIFLSGLVNANNESLYEGIAHPKLSAQNKGIESVVIAYLIRHNIDILHFHTFFRLPVNFLAEAKKLGILILFSVHDYQPLCPVINLLDYKGEICIDPENGNKCVQCNVNSLSNFQFRLRNGFIGTHLQSFKAFKTFVKKVVRKKNIISVPKKINVDKEKAKMFNARLKAIVDNMNNEIDLIVFNSFLSQKVYYNFNVRTNSIVLPVTHHSFKKKIEPFKIEIGKNSFIRFGFLGGNRREKGGRELLDVLHKIVNRGIKNFELHIFGEDCGNLHIPQILSENINIHGYKSKGVFDFFDILIVPSVWQETFGFVLPEALRNKKGVIASANVGAVSFLSSGVLVFDEFKHLETLIVSLLHEGGSLGYKGGLEEMQFEHHYGKLKRLYREKLRIDEN